MTQNAGVAAGAPLDGSDLAGVLASAVPRDVIDDVVVVGQARGGAKLPDERVHRKAELCGCSERC